MERLKASSLVLEGISSVLLHRVNPGYTIQAVRERRLLWLQDLGQGGVGVVVRSLQTSACSMTVFDGYTKAFRYAWHLSMVSVDNSGAGRNLDT